MAGNSCIFRCTNIGDNESNVSDKIEFNGGTTPDGTGHVKSSDVNLEKAIAENDKPFAPINELQDTQASRITVNVVGVIDNPSASPTPGIFKIWELEGNTDTTIFTKGRFGLRLNDFPAFNLTPKQVGNGARGYMISDIKLSKDIEFNRLTFSCTLRFNGDIGTTPYNW